MSNTLSHTVRSGIAGLSLCLIAVASSAESITVLNTYGLPANVNAVRDAAWDGSSVWIADIATTILYEIDPSDGTVLSQIDHPGGNPLGLTWSGTNLFVGDLVAGGGGSEEDRVFEVTTAGATVTSWETPDSPDSAPAGLAYDGNTGNVWLVDDTSSTNTVYELDASDGSVISSFAFPNGIELRGITWRDNQLFAIANEIQQILQLDTSGNILGFVSIAQLGGNPRGITWDGSSFWVTLQAATEDEPGELVQLSATFSPANNLSASEIPTIGPLLLGALMLMLGVVGGRGRWLWPKAR